MESSDVENVIIIGSGPAAYAAAMFLKEKTPLLFEGGMIGSIGPGGQLTTTTDVDNYPGFPKGIQGPTLMSQMRNQALDNGVRIISKTIISVSKDNDIFELCDKKKTYYSRSVIIATGASAKRLYVPGTNDHEFWQKGISACAVCDGYFFKDKVVAVIGGGDSAMEETLYLSNIARKVYLIHRRNEFRAREDKIHKIKSVDNIELKTPAELVSAHGTDFLEMLKLKNTETGEIFELEVDGLFFGIGHVPNTSFIKMDMDFNENGYINTCSKMHTNVPGVFACGDVQDQIFRQAITAASSGAVAGIECMKYLEDLSQ
jgi:thioredoxin reductase (NADPH)